jgi:hypothetical protein
MRLIVNIGINSMKYPVGTRIKYIKSCCKLGRNQEGIIVKIINDNPIIFVSACTCTSWYSTDDCAASVQTRWRHIEPIMLIGQQLQFEFMQ